jgi:hypothetical protein
MKAQCGCGRLTVVAPGPSPAVVACHCLACQRRTGSVQGVVAYYPQAALTIAGEATRFVRPAHSGADFESFFCPTCGSTVYMRAGKHPGLVGVAVGAFGDPAYPPPVRSVWEDTRHGWTGTPDGIPHFPGAPQ